MPRGSAHPAGEQVYKGRKKKSIQFYALKCVDKCEKGKIMREVLPQPRCGGLARRLALAGGLTGTRGRCDFCTDFTRRTRCTSMSGSKLRIISGSSSSSAPEIA